MAATSLISIYLPDNIVTNKDLNKEFPDADFKSFESTVGIFSRHIADPDQTALDLAEIAARRALSRLPDSAPVDFILFCTQTPDFIVPGNAGILQDRLGLDKGIGALDFNLGCSGYVYGLALAKGLINTSVASRVLLITSDTLSKYIHPKDRANRALFGDGATATIIDNTHFKIGEFVFGTDGSGHQHLIIPNGGMRNPWNPNAELTEHGSDNFTDDNHFFMNGLEIFSFTAKTLPKTFEQTLLKNNMEKEDIDLFVFHQANEYMLKFIRKKLKIDEEKFHVNMKTVGNTSGSSIPIALHDLIESGKLCKGNKAMLLGYGIGLSWAGVVVQF